MKTFAILSLAAAALAAPAAVFNENFSVARSENAVKARAEKNALIYYIVPAGAEGETAAPLEARAEANALTYYIVPAGAEGETAASIKTRAVGADSKDPNALIFYIVPAGAEGETAE